MPSPADINGRLRRQSTRRGGSDPDPPDGALPIDRHWDTYPGVLASEPPLLRAVDKLADLVELYDLEQNPGENVNVAAEKAYAATLAKLLSTWLGGWRAQQARVK